MQRRKDINQYINPAYRADPDFIGLVEDYDHTTGEVAAVEIGYAYKNRKGGGVRIILDTDVRAKQLIYESDELIMMPFKRSMAEEKKPKSRAAPKVKAAAAPKMGR